MDRMSFTPGRRGGLPLDRWQSRFSCGTARPDAKIHHSGLGGNFLPGEIGSPRRADNGNSINKVEVMR